MTIEQDAVSLMQLTDWSPSNEMIDTQYGRITIKEWLDKEKERITSDSTRRAEIFSRGNYLALYVDGVT